MKPGSRVSQGANHLGSERIVTIKVGIHGLGLSGRSGFLGLSGSGEFLGCLVCG